VLRTLVEPWPNPGPNAPGIACADPERVSDVLTTAGGAAPRLEKLGLDLDIAGGCGLEAVDQLTRIGAVNSWLRNVSCRRMSAFASQNVG
jgi:hypothetical protein